jgi:hypothetical protein
MGLLTRLVLLPLAPVEGVVWMARRLEDEAERQMHDPDLIREQLAELQRLADEGRVDDTEVAAAEDELLDRLDEALAWQTGEVAT